MDMGWAKLVGQIAQAFGKRVGLLSGLRAPLTGWRRYILAQSMHSRDFQQNVHSEPLTPSTQARLRRVTRDCHAQTAARMRLVRRLFYQKSHLFIRGRLFPPLYGKRQP
jgi:hypothetical protein